MIIEPNNAKHQDIIFEVCKKHQVKSLELTSHHIQLMDNCITTYIEKQTPPVEDGKLGGEELERIIGFLLGERHYDNVWFGEKHPELQGAFWWRSVLRSALKSQPSTTVQDGWVTVEEGLPDDGDIVLVSFVNTVKEICQCAAWFQKVTRHSGKDSPIDNRWFVYPSSGHEIKPTHWQPIPQPPTPKP